MGKHSQYGVIFDAGSSGTRVYVYKWKDHEKAMKEITPGREHSLPKIKIEESKKVHPGVSSFADTPARIGPDHLKALVDVALSEIPESKVPETPVYLMATAGMRLLTSRQQEALLSEMCSYFKKHTNFPITDCKAQFQIIPGETEGLYGWIAANYLLGGFDDASKDSKHHGTYGFLDMGGASAQIAFAPNATEAAKHADDLKLLRFRALDGNPIEYKVFTTTWLGFGANKARDRYIEHLVTKYDHQSGDLPDPCTPRGLRITTKGEVVTGKDKVAGPVLIGTGDFKACLAETQPLLEKDAPCPDPPCLINGQHVPALDFDVNHFVGVSEYWHTTHGVFGAHDDDKDDYDLATYQNKVNTFCSQEWEDIYESIDGRSKSLQDKTQDAIQACFKASWMINVLYEGIGIPRVGLEAEPHNASINPFRPVNKVDGAEVSWTLGKMLLHASAEIPAASSGMLPVGFGSNEAGIPKDFEFGSSITLPKKGASDHEDHDDDDYVHAPSQSFSSIFLFILCILALLFVLRKRERRLRVMSFFQGFSSSRPGVSRSTSFVRKLFRRNTPMYERVMEEGGIEDFELADADGTDSESSFGGRRTPRFNVEGSPVSKIDRSGVVVRTESREQLALPQKLNVGRRSRTGSPARHKSPLIN